MRALLGPEWPKEYADGEVELGWTGGGRPLWKVGAAAYTLEDEARDLEDDRVVEFIETRVRFIGAGGVVLGESTIGDPRLDLN